VFDSTFERHRSDTETEVYLGLGDAFRARERGAFGVHLPASTCLESGGLIVGRVGLLGRATWTSPEALSPQGLNEAPSPETRPTMTNVIRVLQHDQRAKWRATARRSPGPVRGLCCGHSPWAALGVGRVEIGRERESCVRSRECGALRSWSRGSCRTR